MSIRTSDSELPSLRDLGFHEQCAYSWPYHPFVKLFEIHMERHFADYKASVLDLRQPNEESVKKRWWKTKFRHFIRKELRGLKLSHYTYVPSEAAFFEEYPHLKAKWELERTAIVLRESSNDRFGRNRSDFDKHLRMDWVVDRKYEFMMRWLGLRTQEKTRTETRKKYFDYYSDCLLWCHHGQCWKERIKWLPVLLLIWLTFQVYFFWNPSILDIHLKRKSKKSSDQN